MGDHKMQRALYRLSIEMYKTVQVSVVIRSCDLTLDSDTDCGTSFRY